MKQLKRRILYHSAAYILSLMYSLGIAGSLVLTHFLDVPAWDVFKYTAILLLAFTILFLHKWTTILTLIACAGAAYWAFRYRDAADWILDNVLPFLSECWVFLRGQGDLSPGYHLPLALLFIIVTILFSRISTSRLRGCSSMLIVAAAVFIAEWSLGHHNIIPYMSLSAASIASVYAYSFARHLFLRDMSDAEEDYTEEDELFNEGETIKSERRTIRIPNATAIAAFAIPLALIACILASVALPTSAGQFRSQFIESIIDDVVDFAGQYTGLSRKMYSFSISTLGYPSTSNMGGPVQPSDRIAMVVEGISPSLLKGSTKSHYTGKGWTNYGNLGSFRYDSALWTSKRDDVFDLERPDPELHDNSEIQLYRNIRLRIAPHQNLYTIFSPTRPYSIYSAKNSFIPYFNQIGELFPKRRMDYLVPYTVEARQFLPTITSRVRQYIAELEEMVLPEDEEKMKELRERYLQLPAGMPQSVKNTANRLAALANSDSRFLQASAIQDYLSTNFTYTLSPSHVPEDRDFVDYFLETGEGYCTYYASAMVVLARSIGIPARYVEGFLLTNLEHNNFIYTVTGERAHAWAELYFEGIGWIPFDATPIGQPRTTTPDPAPSAPIEPELPIPSPSPSLEPVVDIPTSEKETSLWIYLACIAAVLILLNVILILAHRWNYSKDRMIRKYGKRMAIEHWWRSILDLLPYQDPMFKRRDGETSTMLSARIGLFVQCKVCTFDQLVRIILRCFYSGQEPTDTETDVVYRYFCAMENRMMKTATPPVFAVKRILLPRIFGFRGKKKQ